MTKMANIVMMYIEMIKMRKIVEMMTMKQALCLRHAETKWRQMDSANSGFLLFSLFSASEKLIDDNLFLSSVSVNTLRMLVLKIERMFGQMIKIYVICNIWLFY